MREAIQRFKDFVRDKGLRCTKERKVIVEAVFSNHGHFTVTDIVREIRARGGSSSPSTVYRNIPLLIESGLIREAERSFCKQEQVYEHVYGHRHHDHLICDECGRVVEFADHAIEILQREAAIRHGFTLTRHFMDLHGLCADCRAKLDARAVVSEAQFKEDLP